jgi:hypothetical protein
MKCVGFAIPPIVENTHETKPVIPLLGGFTYFRFLKGFVMPLKHIKNHVYNQCVFAILF